MIYFLRAGENEHVKIGWTKDQSTLKRRIDSLQVGYPHRLAVIRTLEAERWAETWLHCFFINQRLEGEWFTFSSEMLTVEPPEEMPVRGGWPNQRPKPQKPKKPKMVRSRRSGISRRTTSRTIQVGVRFPHAIHSELVANGPITPQVVKAIEWCLGLAAAEPPLDAAAARDAARKALREDSASAAWNYGVRYDPSLRVRAERR